VSESVSDFFDELSTQEHQAPAVTFTIDPVKSQLGAINHRSAMNLTLQLTPSGESRLLAKARAEGKTPEYLIRQAINPILLSIPDEAGADADHSREMTAAEADPSANADPLGQVAKPGKPLCGRRIPINGHSRGHKHPHSPHQSA